MSRKVTKHDIQKARQEWYIFHRDNRNFAKALPADTIRNIAYITTLMPPPEMTVFGGTDQNWITPEAFAQSYKLEIDINLANPWYLSDAGWTEFQRLWQNLPEPVELYTAPCVQLGELSTLSTGDDIKWPPR